MTHRSQVQEKLRHLDISNNLLQNLETATLSITWGQLLEKLNILSKTLQSNEINVSTVARICGSLYECVKHFWIQFKLFEEKTKEKSKVLPYEDHYKRKKIRKVQSHETREQYGTDLTEQESYNVNMFLVIVDRLLSELSQRKTVYNKIRSLFDIFVSGINWDEITISENVK